jgi:hypothetical protein
VVSVIAHQQTHTHLENRDMMRPVGVLKKNDIGAVITELCACARSHAHTHTHAHTDQQLFMYEARAAQ